MRVMTLTAVAVLAAVLPGTGPAAQDKKPLDLKKLGDELFALHNKAREWYRKERLPNANQVRKEIGEPPLPDVLPLKRIAKLDAIAQLHADQMAKAKGFGLPADGKKAEQRAKEAGYAGKVAALYDVAFDRADIARPSAAHVVKRRWEFGLIPIAFGGDWTETGIGVAIAPGQPGDGNGDTIYFCQVFARPSQ